MIERNLPRNALIGFLLISSIFAEKITIGGELMSNKLVWISEANQNCIQNFDELISNLDKIIEEYRNSTKEISSDPTQYIINFKKKVADFRMDTSKLSTYSNKCKELLKNFTQDRKKSLSNAKYSVIVNNKLERNMTLFDKILADISTQKMFLFTLDMRETSMNLNHVKGVEKHISSSKPKPFLPGNTISNIYTKWVELNKKEKENILNGFSERFKIISSLLIILKEILKDTIKELESYVIVLNDFKIENSEKNMLKNPKETLFCRISDQDLDIDVTKYDHIDIIRFKIKINDKPNNSSYQTKEDDNTETIDMENQNKGKFTRELEIDEKMGINENSKLKIGNCSAIIKKEEKDNEEAKYIMNVDIDMEVDESAETRESSIVSLI